MKKLNQLKTFEDACKIEGIEPEKVSVEISVLPETDKKSITAYAKLIIVARAANRLANNGEEWIPNWDSSQWKYWNWFYMGSSGFRFGVCDGWGSDSHVGSRLCFISSEVAEYVANQFTDLYNEFMVIE